MSPPDMPEIPRTWYTQIFGGQAPSDYSQMDEYETPPPAVDRLVFIGETLLELGGKEWLHQHYRKHSNHSLKCKLANILGKKASSWGKLYKLPSRLTISSRIDAEPSIPKLSSEDLFLAYIGAIHLTSRGLAGYGSATIWIKRILDYEQEEGSAESEKESLVPFSLQTSPRTPNGRRLGDMIPADHTSGASPRLPPVDGTPSTANALSELNELVMKRSILVNWKEDASGPDHARTWTVTALVEGKEYTGLAHNKKQAKVVAAEQILKAWLQRCLSMSFSTTSHTMSFPPLPPLKGELMLNVFTHKSLRQPDGNDDNQRYAVLGEKAFEAAVTYCIFLRNPHFRKESFEEERTKLVSAVQYEKWVVHYRLFEKLRFNPAIKEDVHSKEGIRELFHAYLGGIYSQPNGPMILNAWVFLLLTPPQEHYLLPGQHGGMSWSPHYVGHGLPQSDSLISNSVPVKRRRSTTSHSPSPSPPVNPASLPSTLYLPKFNEISTKKRLEVQWPAKQAGLQHAPRWEIDCVVNGRVYGSGVGTSKQLAKEEAAVQAFFALGFDKE